MTDGESIQSELEAIQQALAERDQLRVRRAGLARTHDLLSREAATARSEREREGAQVAEKQAAGYAASAVVARVESNRADLDDVDARLGRLGDLDLRRTAALAAKETWLRGRNAGLGVELDAVKYDRIDEAGRLIRQADEAVAKLATELADVGLQAVEGVEVTDLTQTFDIWFERQTGCRRGCPAARAARTCERRRAGAADHQPGEAAAA